MGTWSDTSGDGRVQGDEWHVTDRSAYPAKASTGEAIIVVFSKVVRTRRVRKDGTRRVPATFLATVIASPVLKPNLPCSTSGEARFVGRRGQLGAIVQTPPGDRLEGAHA